MIFRMNRARFDRIHRGSGTASNHYRRYGSKHMGYTPKQWNKRVRKIKAARKARRIRRRSNG